MHIGNAKYFYSGARKRLVSEFEFINLCKINVPFVWHISTFATQILMSVELYNEFCMAVLPTGHSYIQETFSFAAGPFLINQVTCT